MKITLSWLKDHLDTDASVEVIAETLTRVGLEVEFVDDRAAALAPFTIARVIRAEPHPNADRLRVCLVDTGTGAPVQVVCGAPNARTGMIGVFSPVGSWIPGKKLTLGIGTIRGVESRGMLVSAFELEISDDHEGILDLPADAPLGVRYADWAGLNEAVLDVSVLTHRPDALGHRGIARDLAAAGLGRLKPDAIAPVPGRFPCPVPVRLDLAEADRPLCPAFALRLVRGVENRPSPAWLQQRLKAIGLRPINALVDITNFLTHDRSRPLHVFDAAKVKGGLVVRRAREGESLVALDGKTYALGPETVVIADEAGVESIGGIMGGAASGCDETTTDVLIEAALWDPLSIARSGRLLGSHSDARYRFERGVDPAFTLPGLELATRLVLDLCGGEPSEVVLAGTIPDTHRVVGFPWSEVARLTGLALPRDEMRAILVSLGFSVGAEADVVDVVPPSWRSDIEGKADLVEEIVRIAGLERVASTPFPRLTATVQEPVATPLQRRRRDARRILAARGFEEAVTWSFVSKPEAEPFGGGKPELALANPIAAELSDMRPSLLPGLLKAAQRNADRGQADLSLFEVGPVFADDTPAGQTTFACGIRRGLALPEGEGRHWAGARQPGALDAKADAMALLAGLGVPTGGLQVAPGGPAWFHPGRSATLRFGPKTVIGVCGELHPRALAALDVKGPVVGFEIRLDALPLPKAKPTKNKPKLTLSSFQAVSRDFAFVVDRAVAAGELTRLAAGIDKALISEVSVFDVYEGAHLGADKKSVALAVTLQPRERTLTDAEIEAVGARLVAEMAKRFGAVLRG